jgi:outer membrane protein, heavy metal efflux system
MFPFRATIPVALLGIGLAFSAGAFAQQRPATPTVSLDSLISAALAYNPEIQAAREYAFAADYREPQVSVLDDPMVTFTHWLSSPETRVGPQTNAFMLSQPIPFPGKLGLKGDIAEEEARTVELKFEAVKRDVIFKVKNAYYDLYHADHSLAILDSYLELLRDFSRVAEQKYATGEGIQANVLKSHVEISSVLERRLKLERRRTSITATINALIDRPAATPVGLAATIDTGRSVIAESLLVSNGLANRQELRMTETAVRKSEFMKSLAQLQYYPNFNVQASYISVARRNSMASDAGKDAYSIGIGLNIPIQLGRRSAATEEAEATYRGNALMMRNVENTVRAEIEDLHFQLVTIGRTLDLYDQGLLVQAQNALESALSAYSTGKMDFLNLLDSERMLLQTRLGYVEEQANYQKTLAALERAVGGSFSPANDVMRSK